MALSKMMKTTPAALGLLLGATTAQAGDFTITPLVVEGDSVEGVGLVSSIFNIGVNNAGMWVVEADTDNPDTDADSVLIGPMGLMSREGDGLAMPAGATIDSYDSIFRADSPRFGTNLFLDGTSGSGDDSGVYLVEWGPVFTPTLVVQEGEEAPGLSKGTPFIGFFDVKSNANDLMSVVASVDDPAIPTSVDRALYKLTAGKGGGIGSFELVAAEGQEPVFGVGAINDFGTGPHLSALNDNGDLLFFADIGGDAATDGYIFVHNGDGVLSLLAFEGSGSPVNGRTWDSLNSCRLDINNKGDYVVRGGIEGDSATDTIIAVNNVDLIKQEGDFAPDVDGFFQITSFGTGPVEISDNGDVVWYADWDDANTDIDTGLFVNNTLLIQEGVTMVNGLLVDTVRGVEDGYHMSNNGRYIIAEVVLEGAIDAAVLIDLQPGGDCPFDLDETGAVDAADLAILLAAWGDPYGPADLAELLAAWGDCP